ncbi:hypothetical protein [Cellulomonas dongxiuzhuiae]|uniref:Uncharacterized protein n=1 Tax=Cellulomonas dongxiuzhuiae TaxID=2819979 RepID=A0ABX8GFY0_9CELL|nr:hypothetical protein [Cellulomonas dongxiuzhuiae]MBO3087201.1 hypothetical protein [Cellulomonas dongxiuzhuiae]MBO3090128.1 hypothetical protein [Cellulomonas dongxiuzhuiae]MBO3093402.1 hypothetical protein [Cellulomonas dongxiuzhuiae]QWC14546.1 hypothetical protein KKR89_09055 [Cellulomonas dongxiuzhuiae]
MAAKRSGAWIGGAAFLAVLMMAGGWLLLVAPARADATDVRAQTVAAVQQNDLLELQLASLRVDAAKLDEYKAQLESVRRQVPRTLLDTDLTREIDAIAAANGVTIEDFALTTPMTVVAVAPVPGTEPVAPAVPADDAPADGEAPAEGDALPVPPAPTGPTAPNGMVGVDLSLTVVGTPDEVSAFIAALQEGITRLVGVSGLEVMVLEDQGAQGGQAAVTAGDWQATVRATAYVLAPEATPPAAAAVAPAVAPAEVNS